MEQAPLSSLVASRYLRLGGLAALVLLVLGLTGSGVSAAPSGLVAAYNFDEGTGTTAADSSGNGNTATLSGATWSTTGKCGKALSFNGTSNYVRVNDSASLHLTTGMTLDAWVNMTGGGSWRTVIFKERTGGMTYSLYAQNGSNRPVGQVYVNAEQNAQGTAAVPLNTWTHLATTYDGTTQKLFVNGVQVASRAQTGSIISSTGLLKIGGNAIWSEWFKGLIDDVRIYNRALSQSEIQTDMNTPVSQDNSPPTTPTGLNVTGQTENSVSLAWTGSTDDVGVAGYGIYQNGALVSSSPTTSATVSSLACSTTYSFVVDAFDGAGNRSGKSSPPVSGTTGACDTSPPTVQLTAPTGGTVAGTVAVSANASDNKGVVGVQFKLDGANLGAEDLTAPYSISWDTTTGPNGNHTLTAVARDSSGNQATSAPVTVNVFNQAPNFVNDKLIVGLSEPTNMVFTPDGRMLIIERGGNIWVVQPGASSVDPTPVLQLPNVWTADERGLLGIVLDADFANNGYFYVYYTNTATSKNQVSRFTLVGNQASLSSQVMIWQNDSVADIWHQGGDLHFGPDGKLYVAVGDHLLPQTAQDLNSYNGKILRMNTDGSAPADNPFYDGAGPNKDAIWARGFRNPFRFSFDSVTGRMYVGDVGQDTWEEVDVVQKGANYGWPICEGNCSEPGMTNPTYTYNHSGRDACVIGGFVYRGTQFPADYQGTYIFGDYSQNWIKRMTLDANGNNSGIVNFVPPDGSADGPYGDIVAFTMGPDGSLYYVDNGPFATNNAGSIHRIRNLNANQPPTAVASADTTSSPTAPLTVHFSSAGSTDPEGQALTYSWTFGDGTTSTQANPTHTYNNRGRYTARLTTSDGNSTTPSDVVTITVGNPPQPIITSPINGLKFRAGDTITFSGQASDAEDVSIPASGLTWKVVFHHLGHIHPFIDSVTGSGGTFTIPTTGHSFHELTWFEVVLTARDSDGIETQTSVNIYPDKVNLNFASQPSGLTITMDGIPMTTPFVYDDVIGFQHTISVDSPQFQGGNRYNFASWSDGGAQSHTIAVPATDQAYSANFNLVSSAPAGLVAAYNFNEGNFGTLYDVSGHGNHGTLEGPIWTGTGKYGGALSFDGINDVVTVNDADSLDFTTGFSLEAWVNPTSAGNWSSVLFKQGPQGMNYSLYANNGTNKPVAQVYLSNAEQNAPGTGPVPLNTWTHLAATYDGTTLRLYANGVLAGSKAISGSLLNTPNPLTIGGNAVWSEFFQGQIDEVRLYNRALTATEIQNDMATPL